MAKKDNSDYPFNPLSALDYMPKEKLRSIQLNRLQNVVELAYSNVDLYKERMDEKGVTPDDISSLADIAKLPFTIKDDLRDNYPFGMCAVPLSEIVRVHASSGTTGKPTVVTYTQDDVDLWAGVMERTFACCQVHSGDVIQNSYGYGLFTGGLGAHYGAESLGATVIPTSGGKTDRQIMVLEDFNVDAICTTPSYFIHLIERAEELGVDMKKLNVRAGIFGAEPWTEEMREYIEKAGGIKAYDIYGLSEIIGPGVASECSEQAGLHIFEDHFYPEIIDPETEEVLPEGEEGELVFTTLSKKALPMLRYRTRDITSIITEQCGCGRSIRRIQRIRRRSDDMLIVRGVNVFPSQVEEALLKVEGTMPHYQIVLTRDEGLDEMEVQVEMTPETASDKVKEVEALKKKISESLDSIINIRAKVTLVEPQTIQRSLGKAKRVIDKRDL